MEKKSEAEIDNIESTYWPEVTERLDDEYNHGQRNIAMSILHDHLTSELLATDEEKYIEGVQLAVRGANDKNYTVRDYAAFILWQILQTTEDNQDEKIHELYDGVYQTMKNLAKDSNRRVRVTAKDILWVYKKGRVGP